MCGRYTLFLPPEDLAEGFGVDVDEYAPTYNAAPGQAHPVLTDAAPETLSHQTWGFVPAWADDAGDHRHINARAETLSEKPTFRDAVEQRRCVVPADGFYEWADGEPWRIVREDEAPFAFAGVWSRFTPSTRQAGLEEFAGAPDDPDPVDTFAIVTCEPNDVVASLHDRMPVMLDPGTVVQWLHGDGDTRDALVGPYDGPLEAYRVSPAVNDPTNDGPHLVERRAT